MLPTVVLAAAATYQLPENAKLARVAFVMNAGTLGLLKVDSSTGAVLVQTGTASGTCTIVLELGIQLEKGRVLYNSSAVATLIFA